MSSDKPTMPGHYWYRANNSCAWSVVSVVSDACVQPQGDPTVFYVFFHGQAVPYFIEELNGQWGPFIAPPEGVNDELSSMRCW